MSAGERARAAARRAAALSTLRWRPYTRVFMVGESANWVIDHELRSVSGVAERIGVRVAERWPLAAARRQCVFYGSHFTLFDRPPDPRLGHRVATTYFHGRPGTPGMPEFDTSYARLRAEHARIDRVQVSHRELEQLVLESGIAAGKVHRIPIGIDLSLFHAHTSEARRNARTQLGLPHEAFVVGSFQKDGVGWADGDEPKLIKGPDVLVEACAALCARVPETYVLLSGPARGYVKRGLERHGVPYVHRVLDHYAQIGMLYDAVDAYVVPARQEGGPKGVLEAMAAGVPLVSTRVGQAVDLVRDDENGWLLDVEDVAGIADRLVAIAQAPREELDAVVAAGLATAAGNSYDAQQPLWERFFEGFVRW